MTEDRLGSLCTRLDTLFDQQRAAYKDLTEAVNRLELSIGREITDLKVEQATSSSGFKAEAIRIEALVAKAEARMAERFSDLERRLAEERANSARASYSAITGLIISVGMALMSTVLPFFVRKA
jgi:hypothetical protein